MGTKPSEKLFWPGGSLELVIGLVPYRIGSHVKGTSVFGMERCMRPNRYILREDIVHIVAGKQSFSFMYSYSNSIPLSATMVDGMATQLTKIKFYRLYDSIRRIRESHLKVSQKGTGYTEHLSLQCQRL